MAHMQPLTLWATLTNPSTSAATRIRLRQPNLSGGVWVCSERARRAAFRRIGLDGDPLVNQPVSTSHSLRAIDADGWHTYNVWRA